MLNVTQRHVFVSKKVCRHTSFSVRIRALRRLVVDKFAWKHMKLRNRLHTHTSSCVKIWHGDVLVRQNVYS